MFHQLEGVGVGYSIILLALQNVHRGVGADEGVEQQVLFGIFDQGFGIYGVGSLEPPCVHEGGLILRAKAGPEQGLCKIDGGGDEDEGGKIPQLAG